MRRRACAALLLAALALLGGCAPQKPQEGEAGTLIVTTFYPMYVFTQNVAQGAQGVQVVNMAGQDVGCLHDYQLKTQDMRLLEDASVLVINGGGMERFLSRVIEQRPDLPVIDASDGIDMLESEHEHEHEGEWNAHVWLDPALAAVQVQNIADGLAKADPQNAARYLDNAAAYRQMLEQLDASLRARLAPIEGSEIVTFHEAFDYFARAYGLQIAGVIETEPGESPGTRDLASLCDRVIERGIAALFVEPQYPQRAAETVSRETGAAVYTLDPVVSGDGEPDSYERIMNENAKTLLKALGEEILP